MMMDTKETKGATEEIQITSHVGSGFYKLIEFSGAKNESWEFPYT